MPQTRLLLQANLGTKIISIFTNSLDFASNYLTSKPGCALWGAVVPSPLSKATQGNNEAQYEASPSA